MRGPSPASSRKGVKLRPLKLGRSSPFPLVEGCADSVSMALTDTDLPGTTATPPRAVEAGRYEPGSLILGKYQLLEILGQGGMGSVWLAKNRTLDLDVAFKVMRTELAELAEEIEGIAERMLQEARAAASVGHPAIVKVFDFGFTERGDPFIVMEVLKGESLASAMKRRGRLSPTRAAQTLLPIVDALSATHARGIVHRDLKPENIFLARPAGHRLEPKVLDFGIAKLEQRAQERLTRGGAVLGSPAYMAPEQLRGEADVDARADLWALSVVLYQMITERRPFEGDSYHASMWNVLNALPRPIAEQGIDDAALWRILERGLAKKKEDRYPDMHSFGRDLALWLMDQGVQEDICDATLKAWITDPLTAVRPHNSFFPSHAPRASPSLEPDRASAPIDTSADPPERIEVHGMPRLPPISKQEALPGAEMERLPLPKGAVPLLEANVSTNAGFAVTIVAAALAFLVAAFWFGQKRSSVSDTLSAVGLSGVASTLNLEGADSESADETDEGADLVPRAGEAPELPKSTLKYAPLPKTGPNAPILYLDDRKAPAPAAPAAPRR